jgi:RNA polymerase sigma-70 factor, ECF subfamily
MNRFPHFGKELVMGGRELDDGAVFTGSLERPQLFTLIFDRHYRAVYGYLSRRVGRAVADDLAAETFVRAFERRSTYDHEVGRALPWLLGIAVNLLAHHRRSEARQLRALAAVGPPEAGEAFAGSAESRVDAAAARAGLVRALEAVDDYDREALLLYAWADLSYEEIATVLAIPVGTVRSRLNRARRKVRASLESESAANVVRLPRREEAGGA